MTDSNGQSASAPQHSISTKAIALLVGARPTAPCASGALLSPMLSTRTATPNPTSATERRCQHTGAAAGCPDAARFGHTPDEKAHSLGTAPQADGPCVRLDPRDERLGAQGLG